jgi:hypothetical protein
MPDIARLDDDGVIAAVDTVSPPDYRTDPARRTVALPANHDMRSKLGQYRYDFVRGAFMPLGGEPLAQAERETAGLVDGLVAAVEDIYTHLGVAPHPKAKKALADWRRTVDARRKG